MKKLLNEFKEFAVKGNVIDLAVAVIIGGAFGKITTSLVNDIIMPLIGAIVGGIDFTFLKLTLKDEAVVMYGNFLQVVVNFLIIAWVIFLVLKALKKFEKKAEEKKPDEPKKPSTEELLTEIRDLLKSK
jgi:large conductance mechanosensitive channel